LASPEVALVRGSVGSVKGQLLAGEDLARVTAMCRIYARTGVQLLRDLKNAVLEGIRAFETHEADAVERAGAIVLNAARQTLDVVSAYYRRLAEYTRGHGISADDVVEEVIPADRGIPGHGGPLPLPD
jgi:sulfite reductase (NADPH) flavoprotein alpha-component